MTEKRRRKIGLERVLRGEKCKNKAMVKKKGAGEKVGVNIGK